MKIDRFALGMAGGALLGGLVATVLTAAAQTAQRSPLPVEDLRHFAEVYGAMKANYVEPVVDKKAIANCISGMVSGLDARSEYYDAEAFRELQVLPAGIAGIGTELTAEGGMIKIVSPLEDTPAGRSGLQSGDYLVRIDDTPLKGRTLRDAVKLLRGKPGSEVRLTVLRPGEREREVTVKREIIRSPSVKASMLEGGVALLRVSRLVEQTGQNLAAELGRLYSGPEKPRGIVLDLRNNPGGLLNVAVGVSAVFLEKDAVVGTTDGRAEDSKRRFIANPKDYLRGEKDFSSGVPPEARAAPLAVVVNRGTASGAEMIAGALQDHRRAAVVGEKTFGIGSIQTIFPLNDGTALKLTTARWQRPGGKRIEGEGIAPDVAMEAPAIATDAALAAAVSALKR